MMLVSDYMHPTPRGGRCRIRIYQRDGELPVVVCTELDDNTGMSITNAAEMVASQVLDSHRHDFPAYHSSGKPFVWIEHYQTGSRGTRTDPATFDLVEFEHYEVRDELRGRVWHKEIGSPSWKALDRATVERLVGARVD